MRKSPLGLAMAGTQMVASVLIGSFLGRWIDIRFQSEPWCFLAGFALGTAAGFSELLRFARKE